MRGCFFIKKETRILTKSVFSCISEADPYKNDSKTALSRECEIVSIKPFLYQVCWMVCGYIIWQTNGKQKDVVRCMSKSTFHTSTKGDSLVHGLFTPTDQQLARMREWNEEFDWGFTPEEFAKMEESIPVWPDEELVGVVLVPYLPSLPKGIKSKMRIPSGKGYSAIPEQGFGRTMAELWWLATMQYPSLAVDVSCSMLVPGALTLIHGATFTPGLRWEVINFGANLGCYIRESRDAKRSPHAGVFAAAALHPSLLTSLAEKEQALWIPGCDFKESSRLGQSDADQVPVVQIHERNGGEELWLRGLWNRMCSWRAYIPQFYGTERFRNSILKRL